METCACSGHQSVLIIVIGVENNARVCFRENQRLKHCLFHMKIKHLIFTYIYLYLICTLNSQTFNLSRYVQIGDPSLGRLKFVLLSAWCSPESPGITTFCCGEDKLTTCARHCLQKKDSQSSQHNFLHCRIFEGGLICTKNLPKFVRWKQ